MAIPTSMRANRPCSKQLFVFAHLILLTVLESSYTDCLRFTGEETETERLDNLP